MGRRQKRIMCSKFCTHPAKILYRKITARQRCFMCPGCAFFAEKMLDLLHHVLGQTAIGCDLTTENINQRCFALTGIVFQHIITRRFLCFIRTVIIERTNAGISPDDILPLNRLTKIFASSRTQIIAFGLGDFYFRRIPVIVLIRRADQREIIFIRNSENDTPVIILEEVRAVAIKFLTHNNMAALHKTHIMHLGQTFHTSQNTVHPRACRIDQQT